MENILDIIYEYSKCKKIIDKNAIRRIIKILLEEKNLQEFVKKVSFQKIDNKKTNYNNNSLVPAAYKFYTNEIIFDENKMLKYYNTINNKYCSKFDNEFELFFACNMLLSNIIFHEVEHANQFKKSENKINFENKLLAICNYSENEFMKQGLISKYLILNKTIYIDEELQKHVIIKNRLAKKFLSSSPLERMANIYSSIEMRKLLKEIEDLVPNAINLVEKYLFRYYLKGYDMNKQINAPTERYLSDLKQFDLIWPDDYFDSDFIEDMNKEKNSSLQKRIILGLYVSEDEYEKVKSLL